MSIDSVFNSHVILKSEKARLQKCKNPRCAQWRRRRRILKTAFRRRQRCCMRRIGRIEGRGTTGERERGSTAEGIIMKRNGKQPPRGPGEFRHRLRDSAARPSVARVGTREREKRKGKEGMWEWEVGSLISITVASRRRRQRAGATGASATDGRRCCLPPPPPPSPPSYVFRENLSLRKNGRGEKMPPPPL